VKVALQQAFDLAVAGGSVTRNVVKLAKWPKVRTVRGVGHSVEVHLAVCLPHSGAAGIQAAARALGVGVQQAVASGD
jgi:hypothetical protein